MHKFFARKGLVAFIIAFIGTLIYSIFQNITYFPFDSGYYWQLSQSFTSDGKFTFFAYPEAYRGYFFPWILFLASEFGKLISFDERIGFIILSSGFLAALLTLMIPYIFEPFSNREQGIISRLAVSALTVFFWPGLLLYPLSDLYSFGFTLVSVCMLTYINRSYQQSSLDNKRIHWKHVACALFIGALLYGAYNTRTIYLFSVIVFLPLIFITNFKRGALFLVSFLVALVIGWMLAAFPQMIINHNNLSTWSFGVDTSMVAEQGLFSVQLYSGIFSQRYETVLDTSLPLSGAIRFDDPMGWQVLNTTGGYRIGSFGGGLKLLAKFPIEFIGIYTRHLVNLLNPVYGEVYVLNLHRFKFHYTFINYCLMYLTALGIITYIKLRRSAFDGKQEITNPNQPLVLQLCFLLPIAISCLAIIPGQPEIRFFFPLYVLMYGFLAYVFNLKEIWRLIKEHWILVILTFCSFLFLFIAIWGNTFASAHLQVDLFQ